MHCVFCGAKQPAAPAGGAQAKTIMGYAAADLLKNIEQQKQAGAPAGPAAPAPAPQAPQPAPPGPPPGGDPGGAKTMMADQLGPPPQGMSGPPQGMSGPPQGMSGLP